ncbi:hypothetical protein [Microbacterium sp. A1-JK]|uniref:hypothetical protein n=1 Tax=Microbacterium sp. A1-JK TaxID=3177516 RepID=UPI00388487FC
MSDDDLAPDDHVGSRRRWRRGHRPSIRRSGHVLDVAMWVLLPFAALFFVGSGAGASGRRFAGPVTADGSAGALLWAAVILSVVLVLLIVRRAFVPHPDSYPRWAFVVVAVTVPLTVGFHLLRYGEQSTLAPATFAWAGASFALCVAMCVIPRRHRPDAEPVRRG